MPLLLEVLSRLLVLLVDGFSVVGTGLYNFRFNLALKY